VRARSKPTRLELHRLKYNAAGKRGELMRFEDLDPIEKDLITNDILQAMHVERTGFSGVMDEQVLDEVRMGVLAEWGVMCVHPFYSLKPADHPKAKRCRVCGALVAQWTFWRELELKIARWPG
jgi:hypothetical protein